MDKKVGGLRPEARLAPPEGNMCAYRWPRQKIRLVRALRYLQNISTKNDDEDKE